MHPPHAHEIEVCLYLSDTESVTSLEDRRNCCPAVMVRVPETNAFIQQVQLVNGICVAL